MHYKTRPESGKLKNVHRVSRPLADGRRRVHYYHRPTRIKLVGQPGSAEFMQSYLAAERVWAARREQQLVSAAADTQQAIQTIQESVEA